MKTKKILSAILTLALIIPCFASLTITNVSAHQNLSVSTDFETMSKYDTATSKWKALTESDTIPAPAVSDGKVVGETRKYSSGGFYFDNNASAFMGLNYEDAPANVEKYGKVLKYYVMKDWTVDGTNYAPTSGYLQYSISPQKSFTGSVSIKASFYNNTLNYRTLRIHGTGVSSVQAIRFNEGGSSIAVFGGAGTLNKKWSANKWYDVELKFNIDTKYYEFTVYEDGEFFGKISGVYAASPYKNINSFDMFYNNTVNTIAGNRDQITYLDNLSISSINKLEPPSSDEKEIMTFETFKTQAEGIPSASTGFWTPGYSGNSSLEVTEAVKAPSSESQEKAIDNGTSLRLVGRIPGWNPSVTTSNLYQYPQLRFTSNKVLTDRYRISFDVMISNPNSFNMFIASSSYNAISASSSAMSVFGKKVNCALNNYDWYNFDLVVDGETGYYSLGVKNLTSPSNAPVYVEGYSALIIKAFDANSKIVYFQLNTPSAKTAEYDVYLDNVYMGELYENEVPSSFAHDFSGNSNPAWYRVDYANATSDDVSISSSETENASAVVPLAFMNSKPSYTVTAKVKFTENNSRFIATLYGRNSIIIRPTGITVMDKAYNTISLTPGEVYTLKIEVVAGDSGQIKTYLYDTDGKTQLGYYYGNGKPGNFNPLTFTVDKTGVADTSTSFEITDITYNATVDYSNIDTTETGVMTVESLSGAAAKATIKLPYSYTNSGYIYSADVVFDDFNAAKTFSFGTEAFATVDTNGTLTLGGSTTELKAGEKYALTIDATTTDSTTATVSFGSLSTVLAPTSEIIITSDALASKMSVDNVNYSIKYKFEVKSDEAISDLLINDDIKITFANPLAESVTADNFKVYAPNGTLDDSALVSGVDVAFSKDRKTVTLSFAKQKTTHYHIAFEVSDIYGATLTDVVEADTEFDIYLNDGIKFYDAEGAEVSLLPTGTVTAKATVSSGDGASHGAYMWMGLYDEFGALKVVDFAPVTFDGEAKEVSSSIDVPHDNKAYRLKAGIVKENMAPVVYGEISTQVIIFKLDDLRTGAYSRYVDITEWAVENEVPLSYGMICNFVDAKGNEDGIQAIKDMVETGYVEIWCHGYDHSSTVDENGKATGLSAEFFGDLDAEGQAAILRKCVDNVYEKTDGVVKIQSFGAPHNTINDYTVKALEMVPEFKTMLASGSTFRESDSFLHLNSVLHIESSTGVLHPYDKIKEFHDTRATGKPYMIYQAHGAYWNDESFDYFKQFVNYLKTKDVAFMNPTQYYNFVNQ